MGTIFLVYICMYVCMYVCIYVGMSSIVCGKTIQKNCMLKCVGGITLRVLKKQFWDFETKYRLELPLEFLILPSSGHLKPTCDTHIIHLCYTVEHLAWSKEKPKKNVHLEMRNSNRELQ